jgi:hypothetical protein
MGCGPIGHQKVDVDLHTKCDASSMRFCGRDGDERCSNRFIIAAGQGDAMNRLEIDSVIEGCSTVRDK